MLTMTLARILTWSVTFAYLKYWGFVIMSVVSLATALPFFVQWKKYGSSQALLGAIVAMFGPCMVVNDFGRIFLSHCVPDELFLQSIRFGGKTSQPIRFDHDSTFIVVKYTS